MTNSYIVLDVETSNSDTSSICQIGLVEVGALGIVDKISIMIDPEASFTNTGIHGIAAKDVKGCPTFRAIHPKISQHLTGQILVAHSTFDASAFSNCYRTFGLAPIDCTWVDSIRIAQDAWPELAEGGYALKTRQGLPLPKGQEYCSHCDWSHPKAPGGPSGPLRSSVPLCSSSGGRPTSTG